MPKDDCIFCKIAQKQIPTELLIDTDDVVAFRDINPQAPTHILVIPKEHYESLNEVNDDILMGKLLKAVKEVAAIAGVEDGYRTVLNTGKKAGQEVMHIHFHILAGRPLKWPPG